MSTENNTTLFENNTLFLIQILLVLLGTPAFLFIDSPWVSSYYSHAQDIANAIMIFFYCWFFVVAKPRLYWLILLMTFYSFFAEVIGSLFLTFYQYRLKNIPLYIPLGHALIYATIYRICKQPWILRYHQTIENLLGKFAFVVSFMSLFILKDIAGFLGYIIFLIILHSRKSSLFYLIMFFMVYYVELSGTLFSTWAWYGVVGNHPHYPSIAYTPSGMAGLYIIIDLVSNTTYYYLLKITKYLRKLGIPFKIKPISTKDCSVVLSP